MIENAPPVLGNGQRVLAYAVVDDSVRYVGRRLTFVGNGKGELEELGPVPCIAITEDFKTGEINLLYCDAQWEFLAPGGRYDAVAAAKARAEREYQGVSSLWIESNVSRDEALKIREEMWAELRCSFCDKSPLDVEQMIERNGARICDSCVSRLHKTLNEQSSE